MASASGGGMPFLPPEIQLVVAQHICRNDLPNYRLTNRLCAEAGKPELFHTLTIRFSRASISRFERIRQDGLLSKHVRTLIWDTTLWRVGVNVRDWHEWTRHCELRAKQVDPDQSALYTELAASRQHWEAYLLRLEDEKAAARDINTNHILDMERGRFPNLQKVFVLNGVYKLIGQHVYKVQQPPEIPVTVPLSSWRGDSFSQSCNNCYNFAVPIAAATASAKKWRFNSIAGKELDMLCHSTFINGVEPDLTSIKIRLEARNTAHRSVLDPSWFAIYLTRLLDLESISLDLSARKNYTTSSVRTIQSIFEVTSALNENICLQGPVTWPKLRKLSLRHFDTATDALLSLVARHSATLRDLRLHAIRLCVEGMNINTPLSWPVVLRTIGATTNLENMVLSGVFYDDNIRQNHWDFNNKDLSRDVAFWIINGGECPLKEEME